MSYTRDIATVRRFVTRLMIASKASCMAKQALAVGHHAVRIPRMAHWLMKSEPSVYPWSQLLREGRTPWNGVRNHQANAFMKTMRVGDGALFYHSNEQRAVVGVMRVIALWRPDPDDQTGRFGMVEVAPEAPLPCPVTLAAIKVNPALAAMTILRQSRLSVSPVTPAEWQEILTRGGCPYSSIIRLSGRHVERGLEEA